MNISVTVIINFWDIIFFDKLYNCE